MKLGRPISVLAFIAGCVVICVGQDNKLTTRPDFSGTWELDRDRSNVGRSKSDSPPEQIRIAHVDPELKITKKIFINGQPEEKELIYYTDGRGETNPTTSWITTNPGSQAGRPPETNSKTTWSGDKIVTRSIFRPPPGGPILEFQIIVERRLSSDAKTLTETTHTIAKQDPMSNAIFVPGNTRDFKAVYKLLSK